MKNSTKNVFETLETIASFKADIDVIQAGIEMSASVIANDRISADKARLTMINRNSRTKRMKKINRLSDAAVLILAANTTPDKVESTAIYAVDKLVQLSAFLSGDAAVFGSGRNNSIVYALRGLAKYRPQSINNDLIYGYLTRGGQPHESAATQTGSSCKALLAFDCVSMIKPGYYTVNYTPFLELLMKAVSK